LEEALDLSFDRLLTMMMICNVHSAIIKVLLPTDAQEDCFKGVLKFTLKLQ